MHQVTFLISARPPGCAFQIWLHFSDLWTSCQKNAPQIFDTSRMNKFWWNLASCIAPTLNLKFWARGIQKMKIRPTLDCPGRATQIVVLDLAKTWVITIILVFVLLTAKTLFITTRWVTVSPCRPPFAWLMKTSCMSVHSPLWFNVNDSKLTELVFSRTNN